MNHKANFLDRLDRHNYLVFLCLFAIAFVLRFHSFLPITLDRDEATYAVFADHMLNGSELYKDIQDIKPPGIFLIYSGIQLVFGKSLIAIRLMSMLAVASAAFFLYLVKRTWGFELIPSLLTSVIYILCFNYFFGLSGNTELYFIWCFALGLLVFAKATNSAGYFLSGLVIGVGLLIKQHIAFDFAALGLFFLISSIRSQTFWRNFVSMALMVIGFLIPYVLVHLYFLWNGNWEYYEYVTYIAPNNYSGGHHLVTTLKFNLTAILMFSPFVVMMIMSFRQAHIPAFFKLLIVLLLCFDLVAVNLTGKPFKHYLLQLVIPISLMAGEAYHVSVFRKLLDRKVFQKIAMGIVVVYALTLGVVYRHYRFDTARELVHFFDGRIKPEESLYVADAPSILYWYFDKRSLTKFVHPTLTVFPHHIKELKIDIQEELGGILRQEPSYIVISDRYPHTWFLKAVKEDYDQVADLERYTVYQVKN